MRASAKRASSRSLRRRSARLPLAGPQQQLLLVLERLQQGATAPLHGLDRPLLGQTCLRLALRRCALPRVALDALGQVLLRGGVLRQWLTSR